MANVPNEYPFNTYRTFEHLIDLTTRLEILSYFIWLRIITTDWVLRDYNHSRPRVIKDFKF